MKLHYLAAAPLLLFAAPVLAQSSTGTVAIDGSVAGRCMFTTDNATISLGELALTSNGKLDPAKVNEQSRTLVGWCNSTAATMTVTATPLTNTATAASGFDNRVDYTATARANNVNASDTSVGALAEGDPVNVNMFTGNVLVTLSGASTPNSGLMVAGDYTGNVQVTLAPTVAPPAL